MDLPGTKEAKQNGINDHRQGSKQRFPIEFIGDICRVGEFGIQQKVCWKCRYRQKSGNCSHCHTECQIRIEHGAPPARTNIIIVLDKNAISIVRKTRLMGRLPQHSKANKTFAYQLEYDPPGLLVTTSNVIPISAL